MSGRTGIPGEIRWTVGLGLIGLLFAVPFSAPDGTGMQWDELVLAPVAGISAWGIFRRTRGMDAGYARAWRIVGVGAALFMTAQLLAGLFPGPEFDGFGIDDVILFAGACSPLVTCGMLARRVIRTRWTTLIVDGAAVTVALFVVSDLLLAHPTHGTSAPADLHEMVLSLGGYAAVVLGGAGALCTVSTRALRLAVSTMIGANVWMAAGAIFEALAIVAPHGLWTAGSDVTVVLGLQTVLLAAGRAPRTVETGDLRAAAPRVAAGGMAILLAGMFGLPIALLATIWRGDVLHTDALVGCAVVFGLLAVRVVLRIREDGRITEDLVRNEEDFRDLVESSTDGVAIVDEDLRLLFTSPAARAMLGMTGGARDCSLLELVDPEDRAVVRATIEAGGNPVLHFRVPRAEGIGELEATSSERPGSGRRVLYLRDVTSRRSRERELERMAYTDHLTGLANRASLFEEMAAPGDGAQRSLLVLDLDGFKAVNDVAGHEAGDQLLVEVARRLNTVVRLDDLVTRLGGDEFAVLVTGPLVEATEVAQRVVDTLAIPHRVGDYTFAVGASVGVAILGAAGGQLAFRQADSALGAAKRAGKGCVRVADGAAVMSSLAASSDLATLTAEGTMQLRLDTAVGRDGDVDLVHAYPVWEHPVHGSARGQELYAGAERYGVSADLQNWLLREACARVAALPDQRVGVVVSLPAGHVTADGLAAQVAAALADSGLTPSRLVLSFTEETLLTSSAGLVPELEAARRAGVRLCLDNYGMGHSLFAVLARISLDVVRIDLAALATRDDTDRSLQVLASIVRNTSDFGLLAVAGGISTPELRDAALAAGVDVVHGRNQPHDLSPADLVDLLAAAPAR